MLKANKDATAAILMVFGFAAEMHKLPRGHSSAVLHRGLQLVS